MNEQYFSNLLLTWVWSGFYSVDEVAEMLAERLEDEGEEMPEERQEKLISQQFAEKNAAEVHWPAVTDCDRLDQAFAHLNAHGVIALHNAGYTLSEGLSDVSEALAQWPDGAWHSYCFYHGQDVERAVRNGGLMLAFGSLDDNATRKKQAGETVQAALHEVGLVVEWDGNPETRLSLPRLDWKRLGSAE